MKLKLTPLQIIVISFLLFSLFFGAGNLIFPPFLGSQAGSNMPVAITGFIITAVVLPVLGVIVIAKFDGLDKLASKVNPKFATVFTLVILISIGPGLGIPRAASVPFEMSIAPYLPESYNMKLFLLLYSLAFFGIALWLSLNPSKLPARVGYFLTPTLLILLVALFISFMVKGTGTGIGDPSDIFKDNSFFVGFNDGYQTMDAIAALNFGLVIASTLKTMGINENKRVVKYTLSSGIIAGVVLSAIYIMLAYMGMTTSKEFQGSENGAVILRAIVYDIFGNGGAIILALIFTLACLTTCVGLITSISKYLSELFKKINYKVMVVIITLISTIICNFGLNTILSISIPILNTIYPISIILVLLGLFDRLYRKNKIIYPLTISMTFIISFIYTLYDSKVPLGSFGEACTYILGFELGFGWVTFAVVAIVISIIIDMCIRIYKKRKSKIEMESEL